MNRFLQAKTLNQGDELVWYVTHQNRLLKCLWRNSTHSWDANKPHIDLTFASFWVDTDKCYTVFRLTGLAKVN